MLNAIGLQNPGIDVFCERDIPFLKKYDTKIIVNVCGKTTEDYCAVVERLANEPIDMMEINISCPNVKEGGIAFGQDPKAVEAITREVKKYAKQVPEIGFCFSMFNRTTPYSTKKQLNCAHQKIAVGFMN